MGSLAFWRAGATIPILRLNILGIFGVRRNLNIFI